MSRGKTWLISLFISLFMVSVAACDGSDATDIADESSLDEKADSTGATTANQPVLFTYDETKRVGKAQIDLAQFSATALSQATQYTGATLPKQGVIPAQNLLTSFAKSKALTFPSDEVVNCWYTAIASVMPGFKQARYMDDAEFACQLKVGFTITSKPQFGDVVRFQDSSGVEVHGAVYIGVDKANGQAIVFSKNGPTRETPFGFTTIDSLKSRVYSETAKITYYRPKKKLIDPTSESQECYKEAQDSRLESGQMDGNSGKGSGMLGDWAPM